MKRFGELTLEQKLKLFTAWCNDNASIVFSRDGSTWAQCPTPDWCSDNFYEVVETLPSIDWSQVSEKYNYLVRAVSGDGFLTETRPELGGTGVRSLLWSLPSKDDGWTRADAFKSYKPGTVPYDKSLVERPKGGST